VAAASFAKPSVSSVGTSAATRTYAGWLDTPGWDDAIVARTSGKRVKSMVVALRTGCAAGALFAFHDDIAVGSGRGRLVPTRNNNGRFKAVYRNSGLSGGYWLVEKLTIRGTFTRTGVSGRLWFNASAYASQGGTQIDTCRIGPLRWNARHKPRWAYGGATSQDEPVGLFLSKNRKNVKEIGIGWHTSCANGSFIDMPDDLTNFRIRRGRFGDNWNWTEGGTRYVYRLRGQVGKRSASGTLRVTAYPPSGTSCKTPRIKWRASSR
jgi:hypothetical protein